LPRESILSVSRGVLSIMVAALVLTSTDEMSQVAWHGCAPWQAIVSLLRSPEGEYIQVNERINISFTDFTSSRPENWYSSARQAR